MTMGCSSCSSHTQRNGEDRGNCSCLGDVSEVSIW